MSLLINTFIGYLTLVCSCDKHTNLMLVICVTDRLRISWLHCSFQALHFGATFQDNRLTVKWHKLTTSTHPQAQVLMPKPASREDDLTVEVDGELVTVDGIPVAVQHNQNNPGDSPGQQHPVQLNDDVLVQLNELDDQVEVEIDDDEQITSIDNVSLGIYGGGGGVVWEYDRFTRILTMLL